jgi:hypothetical protein
MSDDDLVWYAAYGSNLLEERFLYYLEGGVLPEARIKHPGARDPRPPRADRALLLPYRLFFAQQSRPWGGGVAFLDSRRQDDAGAWGRAWLISRGQFEDVVRQENRQPELLIDWKTLLATGSWVAPAGWYARLLVVEAEREGHPVVTCTSADESLKGATKAPSERYLGCLAAGLYECYHLGRKGLVDYLAGLPGVKGAFSKGELGRIWEDVVEALDEGRIEEAAEEAADADEAAPETN